MKVKKWLSVLAVSIVLVFGASTVMAASGVMVHPYTGNHVRCNTTVGWGIAGALASAMHTAQCISDYKKAGYVEIERIGIYGFRYGNPDSEPCTVATIAENTPAAEKLKPGDIIRKVNNVPLRTAREYVSKLGLPAIGETRTFIIERNGQELEVEMTSVSAVESEKRIQNKYYENEKGYEAPDSFDNMNPMHGEE